MGIKVGSMGVSDVVVGSIGGGNTNIDKIVIGNHDGTCSVLWQREDDRGPWNSGRWVNSEYDLTFDREYMGFIGNSFFGDVKYLKYFENLGLWILTLSSGNSYDCNYDKYSESLFFNEYEQYFWINED